MYEKTMYKVETKDNKLQYRLQDFTKNDNVDESVFVEGINNKGAKRLECQVFVLHAHEFEALQHKQDSMKAHVETLTDKIKQQNNEIKHLQDKVDEYERGHKDEEFNIMLETRKLEKQHQNELDKLRETHEKDLLDIDETHKENLKQMRAHYTAKLDDVNEHLFNSVKANGNARDKLRGEMVAMKQEHKDEVINLQKQHHNQLATIQHEHSNELQALRKQHEYDIDQLKQASAQIKQEHLVEVNEINERHHVEVDEMRAKFLKLLANEHAQDLSDLNDCEDVPFYIRPFVKAHMKALDEFKKRKYLNTPQKIVESYELVQHRNE